MNEDIKFLVICFLVFIVYWLFKKNYELGSKDLEEPKKVQKKR